MPISYNDLDIIQPEELKGDIKNILQVNRYVDSKLISSAFFEDSRKVRQLIFRHPEVSEIIYEYHKNYSAEIAFDEQNNILEKILFINNLFENRGYDPYFFPKESEPVIEQNDDEQIFRINDTIYYRFKGSSLVEILFDIEGYDESYHLTAEYNDNGKIISSQKKYTRLIDIPPITKYYEHFENGFSVKEDDYIKYILFDKKGRKIRIVTFKYDEDKLQLFKNYAITLDQEIYSRIMKDIRLETFEYDKFDNEISHEKSFYRPDFSKDTLTHYLQEYTYFDKYNIEYGSYYCKTKEDYDDVIEHNSILQYIEEKVNKYEGDQLVATFYIENEKKTRAEFFSPHTYSYENYDQYGNVTESFLKNNSNRETTVIKEEIIYKTE